MLDLPRSEIDIEVQRLINEDAQRPFDLEEGPLFRTMLLQLDADSHVLLVNMHHIISDGWSLNVLIREFSTLYEAFWQKKPSPLPPLPVQYVDFSHWQRQWLKGEVLEKQVNYWKQQLADIPALLELPTDHPRPPIQGYQGASLPISLSPELTTQLKHISQQTGTTLFMTLWSAFATLLSRYSGQSDIVIGSPIANRTHSQTESLIGFFVNTLVLRLDLTDNPPFEDVLQQSRRVALEAYTHQEIPFEQLVEALQPVRALSHSPLFQVMFALQNAPRPDLELAGLNLTILERENVIAKFDLTLELTETTAGISGTLEYNTDLFERVTIERLSGHLQTLLTGIVANPKTPIHELPLLTKAEQQQLLAWNDTATDYPFDQCIHQLFEDQVEKTPEAIAVVFEDQQLTYRELNSQANQLAHYLQTLGVKAKVLVGICVERSLEMVIGLLGILKAGGAYLPLDPTYPAARLAFMLEDAQVPVLLTQSRLKEELPETKAHVVCLDVEALALSRFHCENIISGVGSENLAYVIYTSGSTGKPKGVMLEHAALTHFIHSAVKTYPISQEDSVLQFASLNFDTAVEEIYPILTQGGRLILRDKGMLDTDQHFLQTCQHKAVTILDLPTAYWQQLITAPDNQNHWPKSVRLVIIGGEAASIQHVKHWQQTFKKNVQLLNTYGPTEATVVASSYRLTESASLFPIGKPIPNTKIYILDTHRNPMPVGVPGEICIAGRGLARGYLNRPELSHEKFIEVELFGKTERIYKTGDLARYLPDGNIEYLGRIDHQVKLRGFRIELSEIEIALTQHEAVQEAVVVLYNPEDNPRLVAYVILAMPIDEVSSVLRSWLKTRLPDYMLPASVMVLEKLPLTPNGKIDRKALPAPDALSTKKHYQVPRDMVELQLAQIWENVLEVRPIGISDNFFELGGHSLLAVKLMSQVQQTFDRHLPIATLFQGATIAELASIIRHQDTTWPTLIPIQPQGSRLPLFCLPGAGGNVLYLHSLAAHLGKDQPCYGLQPPGLDGKTTTPNTIEVLASHHLKELQGIQPQGPYYLVGHCFGGKVAFELAHQLEQRGETVALLAILDSSAPTYDKQEEPTATWNETDWLWSIVKIIAELTETEVRLTKETLQSQITLEKSYEFVMQHLKQQDLFFAPTAKSDQLKAIVDSFKAQVHAQLHYQPQGGINAPIVLFRAQEQPEEYYVQNENWDWSQYTSEKVTLEWTPGNHFTMFYEPHVKTLTAQLHTHLFSSTQISPKRNR